MKMRIIKFTKTQWVGVALLASCFTLSYAVTLPNTFTAGTVAKAADVNANFSALATAITELEAKLDVQVAVDTEVCASGAVQCTSSHAAAAASNLNHNPIALFITVTKNGKPVSGLALTDFTFDNPFVPAGGGSANICNTTICGTSNFGGSNGIYTLFLDRAAAGNWKAGAYGAAIKVVHVDGTTTHNGMALVSFNIPFVPVLL